MTSGKSSFLFIEILQMIIDPYEDNCLRRHTVEKKYQPSLQPAMNRINAKILTELELS